MKLRSILISVAAISSLALAGACSSDKEQKLPRQAAAKRQAPAKVAKTAPTPAAPAAPAPAAPAAAGAINPESQKIFDGRCVACHGAKGDGNGPAGAALTPKPRNYTDKAWQKSVTDDQIAKTIVGGGPAVGKSPMMVPNPDLADKPEVVKGLVQIVRNFGK